MNQLTMGYYSKNTTLSFTGYVQYNPKPITANPVRYSDENGGVFILSSSNQKSFTHGQFKIYANQSLFKEKLNLSGLFIMNRYINDGNQYKTTFTGYIYSFTASYDDKNWGVTVDYTSPIKTRFAETTRESSQTLQAQAYYKLGNFRVGLGIQNPFMKGMSATKRELNSNLLKSNSVGYVKSNNNTAYLSASWNFNKGLKRSYQKQLNNSDNTTGIVK